MPTTLARSAVGLLQHSRSSDVIEVSNGLGIGRNAAISLFHVFDAAASTMTARTGVARKEISAYVNDEKRKASVAS